MAEPLHLPYRGFEADDDRHRANVRALEAWEAKHSGGADTHHAQDHAHDGADGSGTVAHSATTGRTANDHHAQDHASRHQAGGADELDGYRLLGRTVLGSAADAVTVSGLLVRRFLLVLVHAIPTGGTITTALRFNNDAGANYARRESVNGGADATTTSATAAVIPAAVDAAFFLVAHIVNRDAEEKLVNATLAHIGAAGAGTAPVRREVVGKWANTTDAITRVDVVNTGAGDFAAGSVVTVLGTD